IAGVVDFTVYLKSDERPHSSEAWQPLDETMRAAFARLPYVAHVFTAREFEHGCPGAEDESVSALVCRTMFPGNGDYYFVPRVGDCAGGAHGASHGVPYRYDRTVPLLVRYAQGGEQGATLPRALFGSYYASLWYALTGERTSNAYGSVVGVR